MHNQHIKPLGLPHGSVRAIIALVIVTVACHEMLSGATPTLLLAETLMIVLTHYFTVRQQVCTDTNINKVGSGVATPTDEAHPLWLPRGSIRILIVLAFIITLVMLMSQKRLFDSNVLILLVPFASYLLGFLFRSRKSVDPSSKPSWWKRAYVHILAILAILVSMALLLMAIYNILPIVPDWISSALLSALLYYFGTR